MAVIRGLSSLLILGVCACYRVHGTGEPRDAGGFDSAPDFGSTDLSADTGEFDAGIDARVPDAGWTCPGEYVLEGTPIADRGVDLVQPTAGGWSYPVANPDWTWTIHHIAPDLETILPERDAEEIPLTVDRTRYPASPTLAIDVDARRTLVRFYDIARTRHFVAVYDFDGRRASTPVEVPFADYRGPEGAVWNGESFSMLSIDERDADRCNTSIVPTELDPGGALVRRGERATIAGTVLASMRRRAGWALLVRSCEGAASPYVLVDISLEGAIGATRSIVSSALGGIVAALPSVEDDAFYVVGAGVAERALVAARVDASDATTSEPTLCSPRYGDLQENLVLIERESANAIAVLFSTIVEGQSETWFVRTRLGSGIAQQTLLASGPPGAPVGLVRFLGDRYALAYRGQFDEALCR